MSATSVESYRDAAVVDLAVLDAHVPVVRHLDPGARVTGGRTVNLVTVRGRRHSPAVGALVREVMRTRWQGRPALAVQVATDPTSGEMQS